MEATGTQVKSESKIFGIPCGCGGRQEIMGAGDWQRDAIILGIVVAIPIAILCYQKWGK